MKRFRLPLAALLLAVLALSAAFLPLEQWITALEAWAAAHPSYAFVVVTACFVLGFLLLLPASLSMMLAGFLFGLGPGFAAIWIAGLCASTLAFWVGRTVARPWIERRIRRQASFTAIDRAIRHKGFLVVLLTRIVMVLPFPALNYSLGLTAVRFRDYVAGSNLGMVPPYFLFVYLGTTVNSITALMSGDVELTGGEVAAGTFALVLVVLVVALIVRAAARALKEELARSTAGA